MTIIKNEQIPRIDKNPQTTQKVQSDDEKSSNEEDDDSDSDSDSNDNDDGVLYCICRKPHNKRFMICCEACDEWFHGSCVNLTQAQCKNFLVLCRSVYTLILFI